MSNEFAQNFGRSPSYDKYYIARPRASGNLGTVKEGVAIIIRCYCTIERYTSVIVSERNNLKFFKLFLRKEHLIIVFIDFYYKSYLSQNTLHNLFASFILYTFWSDTGNLLPTMGQKWLKYITYVRNITNVVLYFSFPSSLGCHGQDQMTIAPLKQLLFSQILVDQLGLWLRAENKDASGKIPRSHLISPLLAHCWTCGGCIPFMAHFVP